MNEMLEDPVIVLAAVVVAVLSLGLAVGGVFWAISRKRKLDKELEAKERLFELEMTRKFDRAAQPTLRGSGTYQAPPADGTSTTPEGFFDSRSDAESAALATGDAPSEAKAPAQEANTGALPAPPVHGGDGPTAVQRSLARLRQLQPDMLEKGHATIRHQIDGEELELNNGKQRAFMVKSLPSPDAISFALKQYDLLIVATEDGEPLIIERAQDVLLRDVGF